MPVVSGTPLIAFADAIFQRLSTDDALVALAPGGIVASLPQASRTLRPYVIVGSQRELQDRTGAGAMSLEGGKASLVIDVFSDYHGPKEVQDIQARIRLLLQREDLPLVGAVLFGGSLMVEDERVIPDFDPDMPERSGFHGVQRVTGLVEELAA